MDEILKEMSPKFQKLYSDVGRPSIGLERLLRSLLLQIFYSVRSERMLIEQLQNITPYMAQKPTNRRSAVDERTARHAGYEVSQRKRKRVGDPVAWCRRSGAFPTGK